MFVDHVRVDSGFFFPISTTQINRSKEGNVMLSKVQLEASGSYRCEVITEAPTFITQFGQGNMTVIGKHCHCVETVIAQSNSFTAIGESIN